MTEDVRRRLARVIASGDGRAVDGELRRAAAQEGLSPYVAWLETGLAGVRAPAAIQLARRARLTRVLDRLAAAGISAVVFKGAHLAYACYPDPALRPYVDTDLFIDPARADDARALFERMGHTLIPHVTGRLVMSQFHYVDGEVGGAHTYDVHWQIANPAAFRDLLPFADVRAQAVPIDAYGEHAFGPSLPHAMLIACVHRAAHHRASDRLLWLLDLRLMLRSATPPERDAFCDLAVRSGSSVVSYDACRRAAELFGDIAVPEQLRSSAASATELTGAYLRSRSSFGRVLLDLRGLGSWRDRAALVREHLFPPATFVRGTSRLPLAALPLAYAIRIIRGFAAWTWPRA